MLSGSLDDDDGRQPTGTKLSLFVFFFGPLSYTVSISFLKGKKKVCLQSRKSLYVMNLIPKMVHDITRYPNNRISTSAVQYRYLLHIHVRSAVVCV